MSATPSQWKVFAGTIILDSWGDHVICTTPESIDRFEETRDNARLIAAAPDLLEACKMALGTLEAEPVEIRKPMNISILRAAIAKAEGEEA